MKISPGFTLSQQRRFWVIAGLIIIAGLYVISKYASIMLGAPYTNSPQLVEASGERGLILDRNGRILAIQTRFGHISVWKPDIIDEDRPILYNTLARILGVDSAEIAEKIESSDNNFLYLQRHVDNNVVREIEKEIAAGFLRGVKIETIFGRVYPEQELAGSIIGIVGDENKGLEGIEYAYDEELSGRFENGESVPGDQVVLTIDANVQYILEEIAGRVMEENEASQVMLMAMDPRSGEILGSASMPGFNPNFFRESTRELRMHRPVEMIYEPGSVFKIFSLSIMLDGGSVGGKDLFYCDGHYERVTNLGERVVINCLGAHGNVNMRDIIVYSCNAGTAYASDSVQSAPFYNGIKRLGFAAKTGVEPPGESAGFLRPVERWSDRSRPTIAIGQEIAVSAVQMMAAASAVANNGVLVRPSFVKQVLSADGKTVRPRSKGDPVRALKPETAALMRDFMTSVTSSIGTGWRANVSDLNMAVKTGTAQMVDPLTGAYSETDFIASCMAMLPAENPALVLYLVIVKPKGISYLGGRIAAPPIREAAEALVNYLGVPRGKNPQVDHTGEVFLRSQDLPAANGRMPNLKGYSKRALLPLLLDDNLKIEIRGDGWVNRQQPSEGTILTPETVIILELE
ncbi:MAG: penicillin-binding protein [Spirochaetaceae bacterium]|jgi:cell division protein FtsI (penicillin-binding protein 3)|nr:penicillin-binding protein [Spirochaetaceae bacterium]